MTSPLPQTRELLTAEREHLYLPHDAYLRLIGTVVIPDSGPFQGRRGRVAAGTLNPRSGEHRYVPVEFDKPVRGVRKAFVPVETIL